MGREREGTHLVILVVDESQLELVLGRVDAEDTRATLAVQAVHVVALDAGDVDGQVQGADDAVVTAQHNTWVTNMGTTHGLLRQAQHMGY